MKKFDVSTIWVVTALLVSGCFAQGTASKDSLTGACFTYSPTPAASFTDLVFTPQASGISRTQWNVFNQDTGVDVTTSLCSAVGLSEKCNLVVGGRHLVTLTYTTLQGKTQTCTDQLNVLARVGSNNAPTIRLDTVNSKGEAVIVSSIRSESKNETRFIQGSTVQFDLSRTRDDRSSAQSLLIEIDRGQGLGFQPASLYTHQIFDLVGNFLIKIRATDGDGNAALLTFIAAVQCDAGVYPPLALDGSQIGVSADSVINFFNYNSANVATGGSGRYDYRWDFNGDSALDSDWASASSVRAYTAYEGTRKVSVYVKDQVCNYFASASRDYNFVIPRANAILRQLQGPQIPGYGFIQSELRSLSPPKFNFQGLTENVNLIVSDPLRPVDVRKINCSYAKKTTTTAELSISGFHSYALSSSRQVGMELFIPEVPDATGYGGTVDSSRAAIQFANYYTDQGSDETARAVYRNDGECTLGLVVTRKPMPAADCQGNQSNNPTYAVTIDGTFSCPALKSAAGNVIEATKGAFYCEVGDVKACMSGGGDDGVPPIPR